MIINFDVFGEAKTPQMTLHNPNGKQVGNISEFKDMKLDISLLNISTLSFSIPHNNLFHDELFDKIKKPRIIKVADIGQFIVDETTYESDGVTKWKHVVCNSLESELCNVTVKLLEGAYTFYDVTNPNETILGKIMSYLPNWQLTDVDTDLWTTKRLFGETTETAYAMLVDTVATTFKCVFKFDTINRTIAVKKYENMTKNTDINVSYSNLVKKLEISEVADGIFTCMHVVGSGGISINEVNPLGTSKIYNYDHYLTHTDNDGEYLMSVDLINAVRGWKGKIENNIEPYKAIVNSIKTANVALLTLNQELIELKKEYTTLETQYKVRVEQGLDVSEIRQQMYAKEDEISTKEAQVKAKKEQLDDYMKQKLTINQSLARENKENFTEIQYQELCLFTIETEYTDEYLAITDAMTENEKVEVYEELYDKAVGILSEVSKPTYAFTTSLVNYLMLQEYQDFTRQTELGCVIRLEIDKGRFAYPILLGYSMTFDKDKCSSIDMDWGSTLRLSNDKDSVGSLLDKAVSSGNKVSIDSSKWNLYEKDKSGISEYMNGSLNASLQNVVNAENQEIVFGENGIIGRKKNDDGTYSPEAFWMMNNTWVMTKDDFQSTDLAIGKILLPDGKTHAYGINGKILVGNLLISKQLHVENEALTFRVDADGVTIKNGNILITDEVTGDDVKLEEYIAKQDEKVSSDLANSIDKVYDDMEAMEQAIKDGEIVIFYQSTKPSIPPAKFGDMWYDTTLVDGVKKNEAWLCVIENGTLKWEKIKDAEVTKALADASNAQTTADGKIKTYYVHSMTPPTNPSVGDLWFKIDLKNELWRYDGEKWVDIHDKRIDGLTSDLAGAINNITNLDKYVKDNVIDTFYQAVPPSNAKYGDMWLNTTNGKLYRRNNVVSSSVWAELWDTITDKDLEDSIKDAEAIANGKIRTFYQPVEPTSDATYTLSEGDLWFNTARKNELKIYRESTKTWIVATYQGINDEMQNALNGKNTTYYSENPPSNPRGGDLWFDTTYVDGVPKNKLSRFDGTVWKEITDKNIIDATILAQNAKDTADGKIVTYMQSSKPTEGSSGDLWIDTDDNNKMYRYDGVDWMPCDYTGISASVAEEIKKVMDKVVDVEDIVDGKVDIFYAESQPLNPQQGDIWIDISKNDKGKPKNIMYRYDNNAWVIIQDSSISDIFGELGQLEAAVDGKVTTYYGTSSQLPPAVELKNGDLWVDTSNNNKLMIRQSGAWVDVSIGGEDLNQDVLLALQKSQEALNKADQAIAMADGQIDTYYQTTQPTDAKIGDLWINASTGRVNILTSSGWSEAKDQSIKDAIDEANKALGIANGKTSTYYQDTEPTVGKIGDMWVDTNDGNKIYMHNGSTWVLTMDQVVEDSNTLLSGVYDGYFDHDKQFWSTQYKGETVPSASVGDIVKEGISGSKAWLLKGQQSIYAKNAIPIESNRRLKFILKVKQTIHAITGHKLSAYKGRKLSEIKGKNLKELSWYDTNEMQVKAGIVCLDKDYNVVGSPKYFVCNGTIIYPNDGWKTFVGEIEGVGTTVNEYPSGAVYFRPVFIVNYPNGSGTVMVDSYVIKDITEAHDLDERFSAELGSALDRIDNVSGRVDGVVEIFYTDKQPTVAKDGDIWYNVASKNEAKMFNGKEWVSIKDQDVLTALDNAQNAQDTADGKITTYYRNNAPYDGEIIDGKAIKLASGDLWFDTDDKNALYVYDPKYPTKWKSAKYEGINDEIQGELDDANDKIDDVTNKVDNVINPDTGEIRTDKLIGSIEAGKNNIDIINNATTKAMKMNEAGILIANSKTGTDWNWKTAISADGIVAEAIKANGTLYGCKLSGGSLISGDESKGDYIEVSPNNPIKVVQSKKLVSSLGYSSIGGGNITVYDKHGAKAFQVECIENGDLEIFGNNDKALIPDPNNDGFFIPNPEPRKVVFKAGMVEFDSQVLCKNIYGTSSAGEKTPYMTYEAVESLIEKKIMFGDLVTKTSLSTTLYNYSKTDHSHNNYASSTHNHNLDYAEKSHSHNYAATSHKHDSDYATKSHTHDYAATNHSHSINSAGNHSHSFSSSSFGGTVGYGGDHTHTINQYSDIRLKENITILDDEDVFEFLKTIDLVSYNFKDKNYKDTKLVGVVAQQLRDSEFGKLFTTQDENGYYGVFYQFLATTAISGLRVLDKKNKELEARIKALEENK